MLYLPHKYFCYSVWYLEVKINGIPYILIYTLVISEPLIIVYQFIMCVWLCCMRINAQMNTKRRILPIQTCILIHNMLRYDSFQVYFNKSLTARINAYKSCIYKIYKITLNKALAVHTGFFWFKVEQTAD